jgi:hypothetical protein
MRSPYAHVLRLEFEQAAQLSRGAASEVGRGCMKRWGLTTLLILSVLTGLIWIGSYLAFVHAGGGGYSSASSVQIAAQRGEISASYSWNSRIPAPAKAYQQFERWACFSYARSGQVYLSDASGTHWVEQRAVYVPCWVVVLLFAAWPAPVLGRSALRARRERMRARLKGHCVKCGYDLAGNISGICPECGTPLARELTSDERSRR